MNSVLVTGSETGPKAEIQPYTIDYTEGRSTLYAQSRETLKLESRSDGAGNNARAPPKSPPHPIQESRGLEQSRASIISQDVEQIQSQQHKAVSRQSSYSPVDTEQIKILVVGDRFTGKSSLIQRTTVTATEFCCQYNYTHLLNCSSKMVRHQEKLYSVTIWDLTESTLDLHEEKYFKEFCSGAMAAFVVYDLSRLSETLSSIVEWKKKIDNTVCKRNGNPIPIYLLGNKCDMEGYQKDGASFAKLHKFTDHFRTSAKTGEGIEEAVRAAVKEILKETYPHPPEICETPSYPHKIQ